LGLSGIGRNRLDIPERYNASEILFHNLTAGRGSRIAVTGPAGKRSYAQLAGDAARWGNAFLALGLLRGDRVLLLLDDTPVYPAAFFGAVRAGLVPILVNLLTTPDLLRFYLADSQAKAAVVEATFSDRFEAVGDAGGGLQTLLIVNGDAGARIAAVETKNALNWLLRFSERLQPADTHRNDMAFWMYSSGSTGNPKGIVHLQHDMVYTHLSYASNVLKLTAGDVCFSVPKIFFSYGFGNSITFPFCAGATSVLMPGRPTPEAVFATIARYRPTVFFGLPTLYTLLANAPDFGSADFSFVRLAVSAAEVLPGELFKTWRAATDLEIVECLGSTEMLNVYLSNTLELKKSGSAGLRVPGYEIALKDDNGAAAADGREGTMWIRGQSGTPLFWNDPARTAKTIREDGWLCTGDRFTRDRDGFYFFRGRTDDLVKISGQWVNPVEVQSCLAEHPLVRECAVLAVRSPEGRGVLKAFVVMNSASGDETAAARALQNHVKRTLVPYKYPRIVQFLSELPKTGTGKIDRQALRRYPVRAREPPRISAARPRTKHSPCRSEQGSAAWRHDAAICSLLESTCCFPRSSTSTADRRSHRSGRASSRASPPDMRTASFRRLSGNGFHSSVIVPLSRTAVTPTAISQPKFFMTSLPGVFRTMRRSSPPWCRSRAPRALPARALYRGPWPAPNSPAGISPGGCALISIQPRARRR
jgi:benzoate-CoA ligase family protein